MKSIIYLNYNQKKILDEANVGVHTLTDATLRDYIATTDYHQIIDMTRQLLYRGNILDKMGFEICSDNAEPVAEEPGLYNANSMLEPTNFLYTETRRLNAACPNSDSIVLWEEESTVSNANDMFKQSMLNIITALSTVLSIEELKQTKQFEICLVDNL